MKNDWYTSFFSGMAVELWQQVFPEEVNSQEAQFAARQLQLTKGDHVLDIGCGHGRHAVLLAKAGYRVTGIDISNECLALARNSADAQAVEVNLVQADLYDQPEFPKCDGVLWLGNGLGYGDQEHTQELLVALAKAVRPGHRMVIDSGAIAESILPHFEESGEYEFGGIRMSSRRTYEPLLGCMDIEYTFEREGVVDVKGCRQWVFMLSRFRRMLETAGWQLVHAFSGLEETPYRLGDRYVYLVAERA